MSRVMKFRRFVEFFEALPKGKLVLDYGAGDRPLEPMLKSRFENYIAADYEPANAAHARRPDIPIVDNNIDVESGTVDCVVLTEVMEHLYEPKEVLSEIYRILKPGGALIGTVPFAIGEHEQPYDFHRYTSFALIRMFEDTGFTVNKLEYVGDSVGVAISAISRVFGIVTKLLHKLKLAPLANVVQLIFRLPELVYYAAVRVGADPGRIGYYRNYPFGFAFSVTKPGGNE